MTYPIYVICRLLLGTLYPGFQSFKAVRTKNVREYVKWMMYWIVFSIYTGIESFSDIFISFWFPFYYEIKIVFLMWLLSPVAKGSLGSSIMYRKFVHPILLKKEEEIDKYMLTIGDQGYKTFWKYANEGFNFITRMVMQTAIKGGGGLITHLKRSYSLSDLATLDGHGSDAEEKRPITIQSLQEVDTGKMVVRERNDNENQKRANFVRRGPPMYSAGEISSGYSSTSEFLPVLGEVLDTEDYEVYDPRIHRRYTPISRSGSTASSVGVTQPGSHTRRKKELSHGFYPLNHSASLPRDFVGYHRSSWIASDSDSNFTGGTVTPSYNPDDEEDENWSDTFEEIPSKIVDVTSEDEDRTPDVLNSCNKMKTEDLLKSASEKISQSQQSLNSLSPKRYKAPEPPSSMMSLSPPRSADIPIPSKKESSSPTLSPNTKCPHCTIHTWLPHIPGCPNLKLKISDKKK